MDQDKIWQAVLAELELTISKANFTTWFKHNTLNKVEGHEATIGVPNAFTKEWLQNKYHKHIVKALKNASNNELFQVKYELGSHLVRPSPIQPVVTPQQNIMQPSVLPQKTAVVSPAPTIQVTVDGDTSLNPRYTFDTYIVGPSNELARAACYSVSCNPGTQYNPLFIYGGVGLGKTHLMHAIGNEVKKRFPEKRVRYVTSERFTNEFIDSISNRNSNFKTRYRDIDILIVDDIQFIAGKEQTQEEFFHTFNTLYGENKQIVLSSDRMPKAIPTLEDRLRTRFEGGMIADIGAPELETRMAILREKCRLKGYEVPNEVVTYIAANIQHNIRELEGALNRVVAHCQLKNVPATQEIAKSILTNILSNPRRRGILPRQIIETVAQFYDCNIDDLLGASRKKEIVRPRQIAMFLMREEIKASFPLIGNELGGRDHTTAMHATDKISKEVEKDESVRQELDLIRQRLYVP